MDFDEWILKLWQTPLKINWSEPLTEEEKIKLCSQSPRIAKLLQQEQKDLRLMKKMADKYEREASAKDSEISKERLKMRLRKKLAVKKEAMAKYGLTHLCTDACEVRQKKRAIKLEAKKVRNAAKSKETKCFEIQQQNLDVQNENKLHQYRDLDEDKDKKENQEEKENKEGDKIKDIGEKNQEEENKEEEGGKDEEIEENEVNKEEEEESELEVESDVEEDSENYDGDKDSDSEVDEEEFNADTNTQPRNYSLPYIDRDLIAKKHQEFLLKLQEKLENYERRYRRRHGKNGKEVKGDQNVEDAMHGIHMELLNIAKGPQQPHGEKLLSGEEKDNGRFVLQPLEMPTLTSSSSTELYFSKDFSKFLNFTYHF